MSIEVVDPQEVLRADYRLSGALPAVTAKIDTADDTTDPARSYYQLLYHSAGHDHGGESGPLPAIRFPEELKSCDCGLVQASPGLSYSLGLTPRAAVLANMDRPAVPAPHPHPVMHSLRVLGRPRHSA